MPSNLLHPEEYELVSRQSSESSDIFNPDDVDSEFQGLRSVSYVHSQPSYFFKLLSIFGFSRFKILFDHFRFQKQRAKSPATHFLKLFRFSTRRVCLLINAVLSIVSLLVLLTAIFNPSYTQFPPRYELLKAQILDSNEGGRGNPESQKIFIAASIFDRSGQLASGDWGKAILDLIDILGNKNVFLSIYENDGGVKAQIALKELESQLHCAHNLTFEQHLSLEGFPRVTLPDGSKRIKRVAYLAEVRNKALLPLEDPSSAVYDRILFLNDVIFNPLDAAQLLFSTHADEHGKAKYLATCAVDFINPFKFYDTFATRDIEGYGLGVPFFPWYSSAGKGLSRQDVLAGKDAVRVRSCWGGMVAFDAKSFQVAKFSEKSEPETLESDGNLTPNDHLKQTLPIRFRAEPDYFWDASECCLVHADLQSIDTIYHRNDDDYGIYQNPFVRVAYDSNSLWWLGYTRRIERLFSLPHSMVNSIVGLPWFNPRRTEQQGNTVTEKVWISDSNMEGGGSFQKITRVATAGGYCGMRTLQVIRESSKAGEKNWETVSLPQG